MKIMPKHFKRKAWTVMAIEVDIRDRAQVNQLVHRTIEEFSQIDIVINNATVTGRAAYFSFLECSDEHFELNC